MNSSCSYETSEGPLLLTFIDSEFSVKRALDNAPAGSGHFSMPALERPDRFRLVMTYTDPLPEVVRYFTVNLSDLDTGAYQESDANRYAYPHHENGAFTRLSEQ